MTAKGGIEQVVMIPVTKIGLSGLNPREGITDESVKELMLSIQEVGIKVPLIIRPSSKDENEYDLVAGERRLTAAKLAGLKAVPCIVRPMDDNEFKLTILLENLMRKDLGPVEIAHGLKVLVEQGLKQKDIASMLGKSQSWVSEHLALLGLDPKVQALVLKGLPVKKAEALRDIQNFQKLFDQVVESINNTDASELKDVNMKEEIRDAIEDGPTVSLSAGICNDDILEDGIDDAALEIFKTENYKTCQKCAAFRKQKNNFDEDVDEYCLNPECFKEKYLPILERFQKEMEEKEKKTNGGKSEPVGAYMTWDYSTNFKATECKSCPHMHVIKEDGARCYLPSCFAMKKKRENAILKRLRDADNAMMQATFQEVMTEEQDLVKALVKSKIGKLIVVSADEDIWFDSQVDAIQALYPKDKITRDKVRDFIRKMTKDMTEEAMTYALRAYMSRVMPPLRFTGDTTRAKDKDKRLKDWSWKLDAAEIEKTVRAEFKDKIDKIKSEPQKDMDKRKKQLEKVENKDLGEEDDPDADEDDADEPLEG